MHPQLPALSETLLWTLHNRAHESRRAGGALRDPDAVRIYDSIRYDFTRHFGPPDGSHARRSAAFDRILGAWIERNPDGVVLALGDGLETQNRRLDNGRVRWVSVDLPEAIELRESLLPATARFRNVVGDVRDLEWKQAVDSAEHRAVFITAAGLLMYLEPESVRHLLSQLATSFPRCELLFDMIPRWFSRLTLLGLRKTAHYTVPPMPFGLDRDEIEPTLRSIHANITRVAITPFPLFDRRWAWVQQVALSIPGLRTRGPNLVHVQLDASERSHVA